MGSHWDSFLPSFSSSLVLAAAAAVVVAAGTSLLPVLGIVNAVGIVVAAGVDVNIVSPGFHRINV